MALQLYNTLTSRKEPFTTAEPGHARIYVCGPTVYDYAHVGHARCYVVYDVLVRHLRASGQRVTYVRNITDIDDKIIARAHETGETPRLLSERFTVAYREDMQRLGNTPADVEPCVSDHLKEIVELIQDLIDRGAAYASDGDVYFDVKSFGGYGKLSHRRLEDMEAGASGRTNSEEERRKKHPADFALWKRSASGEASWPSPWSEGRPGWHIECSAMSMRYLGPSFDLHGGGLDLVFPHHENEIAQSETVTRKPLARIWMHNGFVETQKAKMSKSVGNFFTARELFKRVEPEALRYFVLTVHYRAPLSFDWDVDERGQVLGFPQVEDGEQTIEYLYNTHIRLDVVPPERIDEALKDVAPEIRNYRSSLQAALDDDLNTAVALAHTHEMLSAVNDLAERAKRKKGKVGKQELAAAREALGALAEILGIGADNPAQVLDRIRSRRAAARGLSAEEIEARIAEREAARAARDFTQADAIRTDLANRGVELMDGPSGTTWRVEPRRAPSTEQRTAPTSV